MAIDFRGVSLGPLRGFTASAPSGAVIGVVGANGAGQTELLQTAAGDGSAGARRYYLSPADALHLLPADVIAIDNTFATQDALARAHARVQLDRLRASGATVLIASHEADVILRLCDEVWWLEKGMLVRRGDPNEVWTAYLERVVEQFRAWGETNMPGMDPSFRRGDGRAEVMSIETLDAAGKPTMVWRSGEEVTVRVVIQYREAIEDPVVGVMLRTRVGFDVYGTNTELEQLKIGPCTAGQKVRLDFAFRCDLCNNEYTLSVASHDRDGTAHDWLEDAVAFVVADSRYTAGVANLRAKVSAEQVS